MISRAITGNAPFFPSLAACLVLVAVHWLFTALAFHLHWFGGLTKRKPTLLVKSGKPDHEALRRTHVSEHDLVESLRMHGGLQSLSGVEVAYLERSGDISVVKEGKGA